MSLRNDIRDLYRKEPSLTGKQILERLGRKGTKEEWRILEDEQISLRGLYPDKRKSRNKPKSSSKGIRKEHIYFIPPDPKEE